MAGMEASVLPCSVPPQLKSILKPWSPINIRKVLSREPEDNRESGRVHLKLTLGKERNIKKVYFISCWSLSTFKRPESGGHVLVIEPGEVLVIVCVLAQVEEGEGGQGPVLL